jgi:hypothetical protein
VLADKELVGVLTLYSPGQSAFTDEHERVLEMIAKQVSPIFRRTVTDKHREQSLSVSHLGSEIVSQGRALREIDVNVPFLDGGAVLLVRVPMTEPSVHRHPAQIDRMLNRLDALIRQQLRYTDFLFRSSNDLVALLVNADLGIAAAVGGRIQEVLNQDEHILQSSVLVVAGDIRPDDSSLQQAIERVRIGLPAAGSPIGPNSIRRPGSVH